MERVTATSSKKSRALRRHHLKVAKEGWKVVSDPMIPVERTDFMLLEKFIPSELKEELLLKDIVESIEWLICILSAMRSLIPCILPMMGFFLQSNQWFLL